jgi:hypothetical protein
VGFWTDLVGTLSNTFRIGRGKALFDASGLTASRTFTLPDAAGTIALGAGIPTGGSDGQVLTKTSGSDYAVAWEAPSGGGGTSNRLQSVRVLSTVQSALSGSSTLDGVSLSDGDRVALAGQVDSTENGIWEWDSGTTAFVRPSDYNSSVNAGDKDFYVNTGSHGGELWRIDSATANVDTASVSMRCYNGTRKYTGTGYGRNAFRTVAHGSVAVASGSVLALAIADTGLAYMPMPTDAAWLVRAAFFVVDDANGVDFVEITFCVQNVADVATITAGTIKCLTNNTEYHAADNIPMLGPSAHSINVEVGTESGVAALWFEFVSSETNGIRVVTGDIQVFETIVPPAEEYYS